MDYILEKHSIIAALKALKKGGRLGEVSGWKLMRLIADPSYGNLRLVRKNIMRGEGSSDFEEICGKILKDAVIESQQESQESLVSEESQEEEELVLSNQTVTFVEKSAVTTGHNVKNLTGKITKNHTKWYFSGQAVSVKNGKLWNVVGNFAIEIIIVMKAGVTIDFSDIPEMSVLMKDSAGKKKPDYLAPTQTATHKSSLKWKDRDPAGFSSAQSHFKHLVSKVDASFVWDYLVRAGVVDIKDKDKWVATAKTFQGDWAAMTKDPKFWSLLLQQHVNATKGKTLNDMDVNYWTVDLVLERANVAKALADLRKNGTLNQVSGWKLAQLMMDPAHGNIQLVYKNVQRGAGKTTWNEIYGKVRKDEFISKEPPTKKQKVLLIEDDSSDDDDDDDEI